MRPYEFWNPRFFETPYYAYLLMQCARRALPVKALAKANYGLDHGELGLGSKYSTQLAFKQERFPPTQVIDPACENAADAARRFARQHGVPLILKPDIGAVGKGIRKLDDDAGLQIAIKRIETPHLLQTFIPFKEEYGVFFVRVGGRNRISGINKKHFPTVIGNGRDSIQTLAEAHERFTHHWRIFLKYVDTSHIPALGESVRLSFIGSHTMGCRFTDDTGLATDALRACVFDVCDSQPGFNFGRLDVKAESEEAFLSGEFVVIEVNGIASLPTHMFDPRKPLREAYRIFFEHGRYLAAIADEHRDRPMDLKPYGEIWNLAKRNHVKLNELHQQAMSS